MRTNGIHLRSKDEIRELLGRSPDKGDAIVLAASLLSIAGGGIEETDLAGEIRDSMKGETDEGGHYMHGGSILDMDF